MTNRARVGIPHPLDLKIDQFEALTRDNKIYITDVTEKSDGMSHIMGYDGQGFYTQNSASSTERMRYPADYHTRAMKRSFETETPYSLNVVNAFMQIHKILAANIKLQYHLNVQYQNLGHDIIVRGEIFYRPLSSPSDVHSHEIKCIGTSYDPSHMGSVGKYIIHSKLSDNFHVDIEHFKNELSCDKINFDDDIIDFVPTQLDLLIEMGYYNTLDHQLIRSRTTPKNRTYKAIEVAKFLEIKKIVADKIDEHFNSINIKPKWGSGTEGYIIHPSNNNPDAPRIKVTSKEQREKMRIQKLLKDESNGR